MTEEEDFLQGFFPAMKDAVENVEEAYLYFSAKYGTENAAMLTVAAILEENLTRIGNGIADLKDD